MVHIVVVDPIISELRKSGGTPLKVAASYWPGELLRIDRLAHGDEVSSPLDHRASLAFSFSVVGKAFTCSDDASLQARMEQEIRAAVAHTVTFTLLQTDDLAKVVFSDGRSTSVSDATVLRMNELFSRIAPVANLPRLSTAKVCVIGLGSGGSRVAWELAKSGVGRFLLVDYDRLEPANLSRHICGIRDLGRLKTRAVAEMLRETNPRVEVDVLEVDILQEPDLFETQLKGCDLLVAASGTGRSYSVLNEISVRIGIPAVYAGVWERASAGYVMRVVPGKGACFNCVHEAILKNAPETPASVIDYTLSPESQELASEPGLSVDIGIITLLQARLVLLLLQHEANSTLPREIDGYPTYVLWVGQTLLLAAPEDGRKLQDVRSDYFLWTNRQYKELEPFSILRATVPRRDDCAICNKEGWLAKLAGEQGLPIDDLRRAIETPGRIVEDSPGAGDPPSST